MAVYLGGSRNNLIKGSGESDSLNGYGGSDTLYARRGDDQIDGGEGADIMYGQLGNDTFFVDDAGDRVVEFRDEGFFDLVRSSVSFYLTPNVEDLVLVGTANINGIGNVLENRIVGNEGDNRLNGHDGVDRLEGREGHDTYIISDFFEEEEGNINEEVRVLFDEIVEFEGEGVDTIWLKIESRTSSGRGITYEMPDGVENLVILQGGSVEGNRSANTIRGNNGGDSLNGGDGDDVLRGEGAYDFLQGGSGVDSFYGGRGDDYIVCERGVVDKIFFDVNPDQDKLINLGSEDRLYLDTSIYSSAGERGALDPDAFHVGHRAEDAEDRIIYFRSSSYYEDSALLYDPDGTGPQAARVIATIDDYYGLPNLTAANFVLYGG